MSGQDVHGDIGKSVWSDYPDYEERKKFYRGMAKTFIFCKFYGGGVKKIAEFIECDESEARKFSDKFNEEIPSIGIFTRKMVQQVRKHGYIENPFGRRSYIDKDFAYKGVNYMIQGTAADVLKNAMIEVHELFQTEKWRGCHILIPMHDEIICEIPKRLHCKELQDEIKLCMQKDGPLLGVPVPFKISLKIAQPRWANAE